MQNIVRADAPVGKVIQSVAHLQPNDRYERKKNCYQSEVRNVREQVGETTEQ